MFYSILFRNQEQHQLTRQAAEPECFKDQNLNQIFAPIFKRKKEFELEGFFYTSLHDAEIIAYRQDVMRELEDAELRRLFTGHCKTIYDLDRYMDGIRTSLTAEDSYENNYLTRGRMLDYADKYCRELSALAAGLHGRTLRSEGLSAFAEYLAAYSASEAYAGLRAHVARLRTITRFAREIQFYLAWLDHMLPLREAGLPFNYPTLSATAEHLYDLAGFDLALAFLTQDKTVTNDFMLNTPERIIVVTGPNQGGKTGAHREFFQQAARRTRLLCRLPQSQRYPARPQYADLHSGYSSR